MGAVGQFLLTVVGHLGVLVVEEVIFEGSTEFRGELIASSDGEEGRHVVARAGTILERSGGSSQLRRQGLTDFLQCGFAIDRYGSHLSHQTVAQTGIEDVGAVLGVELGTELIAGRQRQRTLVVVDADQRGEAPAFLIDVEQELGQLSVLILRVGDDMAAIVAVVVVHTHADGC